MIDAIRNGDEFAFEQAYLQHKEKVQGYLLKRIKNPEDASDLLQTVFLKLWKYRKSLSTDFLLEQQLFHIARTVIIDHFRIQSRKSKLEKHPVSHQDFEQISTVFDLKSRMAAILGRMPALRKKVFELNRLEGYSHQEIASHLSISVKSVDNNLTKALRQLRKMMMLAIIYGLVIP